MARCPHCSKLTEDCTCTRAPLGTRQATCCGATVPPTDPVMEAIAKKLFGIETVPKMEQQKMIKRAVIAGAKELRNHNNGYTNGRNSKAAY